MGEHSKHITIASILALVDTLATSLVSSDCHAITATVLALAARALVECVCTGTRVWDASGQDPALDP